jgi:hypothetical protein
MNLPHRGIGRPSRAASLKLVVCKKSCDEVSKEFGKLTP